MKLTRGLPEARFARSCLEPRAAYCWALPGACADDIGDNTDQALLVLREL